MFRAPLPLLLLLAVAVPAVARPALASPPTTPPGYVVAYEVNQTALGAQRVDATTGDVVWTLGQPLGIETGRGDVVVADDLAVLFRGPDLLSLEAISLADGTQQWRVELSSTAQCPGDQAALDTFHDEAGDQRVLLFCGGAAPSITVFSTDSGAVVWTAALPTELGPVSILPIVEGAPAYAYILCVGNTTSSGCSTYAYDLHARAFVTPRVALPCAGHNRNGTLFFAVGAPDVVPGNESGTYAITSTVQQFSAGGKVTASTSVYGGPFPNPPPTVTNIFAELSPDESTLLVGIRSEVDGPAGHSAGAFTTLLSSATLTGKAQVLSTDHAMPLNDGGFVALVSRTPTSRDPTLTVSPARFSNAGALLWTGASFGPVDPVHPAAGFPRLMPGPNMTVAMVLPSTRDASGEPHTSVCVFDVADGRLLWQRQAVAVFPTPPGPAWAASSLLRVKTNRGLRQRNQRMRSHE